MEVWAGDGFFMDYGRVSEVCGLKDKFRKFFNVESMIDLNFGFGFEEGIMSEGEGIN